MVVARAVELRLDDVHLIVAVVVVFVAGNNSIHRDHRDFILRIVILQKTFFQLRPDLARARGFEIVIEARVHRELNENHQSRNTQQHGQNDRNDHPTATPARLGCGRRDDGGRR